MDGIDSELRYRVQVLDRALDVLDCFTFTERELSLAEIVRKTQLNKTTIKRILSNLTRRKYLRQDPGTKKYRLGLRLFELGGIVFSSFSLRKAADHHMEYFRDKTGATVLMGTIMEDQLVYINKREGNSLIRIVSEIGWRRPLNYGMLGMVLLAYQNEMFVKNILDKYPLKPYTQNSITDIKRFLSRLSEIRRQGFVIEREEAVQGVIGIAAPIKDNSSRTIAAMGIALPISQNTSDAYTKELADKLKKACAKISSNIGYKNG